jgi:hypothetical protein
VDLVRRASARSRSSQGSQLNLTYIYDLSAALRNRSGIRYRSTTTTMSGKGGNRRNDRGGTGNKAKVPVKEDPMSVWNRISAGANIASKVAQELCNNPRDGVVDGDSVMEAINRETEVKNAAMNIRCHNGGSSGSSRSGSDSYDEEFEGDDDYARLTHAERTVVDKDDGDLMSVKAHLFFRGTAAEFQNGKDFCVRPIACDVFDKTDYKPLIANVHVINQSNTFPFPVEFQFTQGFSHNVLVVDEKEDTSKRVAHMIPADIPTCVQVGREHGTIFELNNRPTVTNVQWNYSHEDPDKIVEQSVSMPSLETLLPVNTKVLPEMEAEYEKLKATWTSKDGTSSFVLKGSPLDNLVRDTNPGAYNKVPITWISNSLVGKTHTIMAKSDIEAAIDTLKEIQKSSPVSKIGGIQAKISRHHGQDWTHDSHANSREPYEKKDLDKQIHTVQIGLGFDIVAKQ